MSGHVRPAGTGDRRHPHERVLETPSIVREKSSRGTEPGQAHEGRQVRWWRRRRETKPSHALGHDFRSVQEAMRWVASQEAPDKYEVVVQPQVVRLSSVALETVWDQLRGDGTLQAGVDLFYDRATRHHRLEHYFVGVDITRLRRHMFGMLVKVTGGPESAYTGRDLRTAHAHLGITGRDYDLTISILVDALRDVRVPEDAIANLGQRVSGTRQEIVAD